MFGTLEPKQEEACLYAENTVYGRVTQVNNVLIISPQVCSILKSVRIKGDWITGLPTVHYIGTSRASVLNT